MATVAWPTTPQAVARGVQATSASAGSVKEDITTGNPSLSRIDTSLPQVRYEADQN